MPGDSKFPPADATNEKQGVRLIGQFTIADIQDNSNTH
ncbi:hypothetical protein SDC9_197518 [bioreactor metagenome]|uniref:Uncharacterized protein n=1 Tax=bioreactor metagenome TaxID=1076179 RepID=A0A645INI1_9ZZZZ